MCGIFGSFNLDRNSPLDSRIAQQLGEHLRHRGPDQEGLIRCHCLGHRRLSISICLKPAAGPCPMRTRPWIALTVKSTIAGNCTRAGGNKGTSSDPMDTEVICVNQVKPAQKLRYVCLPFGTRATDIVYGARSTGKKPLYYYTILGLLFARNERLVLHPRLPGRLTCKHRQF
jgi:hypothetical protein